MSFLVLLNKCSSLHLLDVYILNTVVLLNSDALFCILFFKYLIHFSTTVEEKCVPLQ